MNLASLRSTDPAQTAKQRKIIRGLTSWLILGLFFFTSFAGAQPARLIADVNTSDGNSGSLGYYASAWAQNPVVVGGKLLFQVDDGVNGKELWITDHTPEGTRMIKDVLPGGESGVWDDETEFVILNDTLYFAGGVSGATGKYLWRSDGTTAGTEAVFGGATVEEIEIFQNTLWFIGRDEDNFFALWRSDGTAQGTQRIASLPDDTLPTNGAQLVSAGERLFFVTESGFRKVTLWRSDGTETGTYSLDTELQWAGLAQLTPLEDTLFFTAYAPESNGRLWRSDGSKVGTYAIQPIEQPVELNAVSRILPVGERVMVDSASGMWSSDGTDAGTVYLGAFETGDGLVVNNQLYFAGSDAEHGLELWRSDGTPSGTSLVSDLNPGPEGSDAGAMEFFRGELYFVAFREGVGFALWATNGTAEGTRLVADPSRGTSRTGNDDRPRRPKSSGDVLYFVAKDGAGFELWQSYGSPETTQRFIGFTPGTASSSIHFLTTHNDRFLLTSSSDEHGAELFWSLDGSPEGTRLLQEFKSVGRNSNPVDFRPLKQGLVMTAYRHSDTVINQASAVLLRTGEGFDAVQVLSDDGGRLEAPDWPVFFAYDHLLRSWGDGFLSTDGGPDSSTILEAPQIDASWDADAARWQAGNTLYYLRKQRTELWATDGTLPGTRKIFSIQNLNEAQRNIGSVFPTDNGVYLTSRSYTDLHTRIWRLDPQSNAVENIYAPDTSVNITQLVPLNEQLLIVSKHNNYDVRLLALNPLTGNLVELFSECGDVGKLTQMGHQLIFPAFAYQACSYQDTPPFGYSLYGPDYGDVSGPEPWITDGTVAGTKMLRDIRPGARGSMSIISTAVVLDQQAVFVADDGEHGAEIWVTDGTSSGTQLVKDIYPGFASAVPGPKLSSRGPQDSYGYEDYAYPDAAVVSFVLDGHLVFPAADGHNGLELWVTDGSAEGTRQIQDINPGPGSSAPLLFTRYGQHVVFSANDGVSGREPWVIPVSGLVPMDFGDAPAERYPTVLADDGARHKVGRLFLGQSVDAELDAGQDAGNTATADDTTGSWDEDGVEFGELLLGSASNSVTVTVSQPGVGRLDAWIDLNQDGDWDDLGEQIFSRAALPEFNNRLSFLLPETVTNANGASTPALAGNTYARFRLSSGAALRPAGVGLDGETPDGEVEDYQVTLKAARDVGEPTPTPTATPSQTPLPTTTPISTSTPTPQPDSEPSPTPPTPSANPTASATPSPVTPAPSSPPDSPASDSEESGNSGALGFYVLLLVFATLIGRMKRVELK